VSARNEYLQPMDHKIAKNPCVKYVYFILIYFSHRYKVKGKAIPVTGRGGPWGCEKLKLSHFQDNRLTDGDKAVSPTRLPPFTLRRITGTHFC
jgi:hypothetical protein